MNAFDHERDAELGRVLRQHLEMNDQETFVARVLRSLPVGCQVDSWQVLERWALPGIAAALLVAATLGLWIGLPWGESRESRTGATTVAERMLEPGQPLDSSVILAAVLAEP
jgi:hypothetical protein